MTPVTAISTRTAAECAIAQLEACGATTVFGIPGVHTLELYDALGASNLRHVLARHEQGAGFMADGFARATGRPAVALVITGPGVTNVVTPVGQAYTDSSPVFVLSTNVRRAWLDAMRGDLHDLKDQQGVMRAVTTWNARAMQPEEVAPLIAEGWRRMTSGRTLPVHLEIPLDLLPLDVESDLSTTGQHSAPTDDAWLDLVEEAAEALAGAARPLILAGGGATVANVGADILAIAEQLNAPILTSVQGKGAVPDGHPLVCTAQWSHGNPLDELVQRSDALLVIGSRLGAQWTGGFRFPLPETLVRIEIDAEEMGRNATPSVSLLADAREATTALADAITTREPKSRWSREEIAAAREAALAAAFGVERADWLCAIRAAMPDDGVVTWDMTMMAYAAQNHYPFTRPRTYLFPMGYGTLGFALPAAIGAKIGVGDRAVAAVVGDGGLQFTMQEIATAVQERLGIPIIVFNDSTYSAVKYEQVERYGGRTTGVDLANPDFVKLADAYGISGARVDSPDELKTEIIAALARDLPTIIDVPIPGWV